MELAALAFCIQATDAQAFYLTFNPNFEEAQVIALDEMTNRMSAVLVERLDGDSQAFAVLMHDAVNDLGEHSGADLIAAGTDCRADFGTQ